MGGYFNLKSFEQLREPNSSFRSPVKGNESPKSNHSGNSSGSAANRPLFPVSTYRYRHDPYNMFTGRLDEQTDSVSRLHPEQQQQHGVEEHYPEEGYCQDEVAAQYMQMQDKSCFPAPPLGTLHTELVGRVTFVPYPTEAIHAPPPSIPKQKMVRVFLGQLPYQVSDMQLDWICATFGGGNFVYYPERIVKADTVRGSGARVPTGCIHAYCDPAVAQNLLECLHKRLLVDDTGVWVAENEDEHEQLTQYCTVMKLDKSRRVQHRPYDTVVAQFATSNFVPQNRTYNPRRWH